MKRDVTESYLTLKDYILFALLAVIALSLVLGSIQLGKINSTLSSMDRLPTQGGVQVPTGAQVAAPTPSAQAPGQFISVPAGNSPVLGKDSAKVTLVEFSDFECPFCARFYTDALKDIKTNYVDTGLVKIIFKQLPLDFHQEAQKAAEASLCADKQGKFWAMHDMLFEKGVVGGVSTFKQYAADLKLDTTKFNNCLDNGETAAQVAEEKAQAASAGISGTPSFVLNGKVIVGAQPFASFKTAIDAALASN